MKNKALLTLLALGFSIFLSAQSQVTFYTNYGNFEVELHDSLAPITAGNFISLVNNRHYDGKQFYRVISNFVIQGGSWPTTSNPIPDEFDSTGTLTNKKMALSMANSGPNTGSSEFFINLKNNFFLDYDKAPLSSAHPVFGIVRGNWNVVDSIGKAPTNGNDAPLIPVIMDSLRITGSYLTVYEIERMKTVTQVYPNPISDQSILDIYIENGGEVHISLFDQNGKRISEAEFLLSSGKTQIPLTNIGVQNLPNGAYILKISAKNLNIQEKLIVAK